MFLNFRLFFSSCGPAQWRLNGPDADPEAVDIVKSVPLTTMMNYIGYFLLLLIVFLILSIFECPLLLLTTFGLSYFIYKQLNN